MISYYPSKTSTYSTAECVPIMFTNHNNGPLFTPIIVNRTFNGSTYDTYAFPHHRSDWCNVKLSTGGYGGGYAPGFVHWCGYARGAVDALCNTSFSSASDAVTAYNNSVVLYKEQSAHSMNGMYIAPTAVGLEGGGWNTFDVGGKLSGGFYKSDVPTPRSYSSVTSSNQAYPGSLKLTPYSYDGKSDTFTTFWYLVESYNAKITGGTSPSTSPFSSITSSSQYIRSGYSSSSPSNYVYSVVGFDTYSQYISSTDDRELFYPFVYAEAASGASTFYASIRAMIAVTSYVRSC